MDPANPVNREQAWAAHTQQFADKLSLMKELGQLMTEMREDISEARYMDRMTRASYLGFLLTGQEAADTVKPDLSTNKQLLKHLNSGEVNDAVEFFDKRNTPLDHIQMYLLEIARVGKNTSDGAILENTCVNTFLRCVSKAPAESRSGFPFATIVSVAATFSSDTLTANLIKSAEGTMRFYNESVFNSTYEQCLKKNAVESLELLEGLSDFDRFSFTSSDNVDLLCRIYDRRDGQFERLVAWIEKEKFDLGTKIRKLSVIEFIVKKGNLELFEDILDIKPSLAQDEEEEKLINYIEKNTVRSLEFISAIYKKQADGIKTGETE